MVQSLNTQMQYLKFPSAARMLTTITQLIQIQLFLTLMSLPILIWWGLPISLMAPLANLTLGPILTTFLTLSFLIFWCEIFHIPNTFFISCLEKVTSWWNALLNTGNTSWLIGFAKPSLLILIIIPMATIALILHKKINSPFKMICGLSLLLSISYGWLTLLQKTPAAQQQLPCNKGALTILFHQKQLVIIDPGFLGQRISTPSWVEYTLIPHIYSSTGAQAIEHLIVMQPGKVVFDALTTLINTIPVKKLYLPFWQGKIANYEWRSFAQLKAAAKQHGTKLIRIFAKPITIPLSQNGTIIIEPLSTERIKTNTFDYPAVRTTYTIDDTQKDLYSVKYKKPVVQTVKTVVPSVAN
jgi:hypothetical protein